MNSSALKPVILPSLRRDQQIGNQEKTTKPSSVANSNTNYVDSGLKSKRTQSDLNSRRIQSDSVTGGSESGTINPWQALPQNNSCQELQNHSQYSGISWADFDDDSETPMDFNGPLFDDDVDNAITQVVSISERENNPIKSNNNQSSVNENGKTLTESDSACIAYRAEISDSSSEGSSDRPPTTVPFNQKQRPHTIATNDQLKNHQTRPTHSKPRDQNSRRNSTTKSRSRPSQVDRSEAITNIRSDEIPKNELWDKPIDELAQLIQSMVRQPSRH